MADDVTVIHGDFVYRDLIRRRNAKEPEERWFGERAPFRVAAADAATLPVAIECALTDTIGGRTRPAAYRMGPDGFMFPTGTPESLASVATARMALPYESDSDAFPLGRLRKRNDYEQGLYASSERAKVVTSGRDAGLARAHAAAAASRLLDGAVWSVAKPPVIEISHDTRNHRDMAVVYVAGDDRASLRWEPRFHVEDLDAALEHARWVSAHPWLLGHGGTVAAPEPARIAVSPSRDAFLLDAARGLVRSLSGSTWGGDFPGLAPTILESWARFRRHGEAVLAGDAAAIAPAHEALGDILDRIPQVAGFVYKDATALQDLRQRLEEPVRHWRSYLRHLVPTPAPEDDLDAMAGLAR